MTRLTASLLAFAVIGAPASAAIVYETDDPFGGFFGLWGMDIYETQTAGVRFTPSADYYLDEIKVWFMNNDVSPSLVLVTLQDDHAAGSIPGLTVLDSGSFFVSAVGWDPQFESVVSSNRPLLKGGTNYWVVCASDAPGGTSGVWNFAGFGVNFHANTNPGTGEWQPGGSGAALCLTVIGTLVGDIDGDGHVGQADLAQLLASYGLCDGDGGFDPAADVDGDGCVGQADLAALLANYGV